MVGNCPIATSTVYPLTKKKSVAKATKKAPAPTPMSLFAPTSFASASMASTVPNSKADLNFSGADMDIEVKLVVPRIIHKPEREEGITANLRVDFKER